MFKSRGIVYLHKNHILGETVDDLPDGNLEMRENVENSQLEDKNSDNLSSTSILKEKIQDISVEEEAAIQQKLSQAKAEIQNLILEGKRLKQANQQLQNDIDSHSSLRLVNIF